MKIRQPIVTVLGHVDSGKTSLLDRIRGTGVQDREAGGITQHIGASFLPVDTLREACGPLYKKLESGTMQVPGILVIDTPGHEIFTNLRDRGGSAADIAILVMDVSRGLQPQTRESLEILKSRKVPFVVALNKCDQISGWRKDGEMFISKAIKAQDKSVQADLEQKIYDVVGSLSILGYQSDVFYNIDDFRKKIAIVPVSARTGTGIPELLAVLVGLTQQYMSKRLDQDEKTTHGMVFEVNNEAGLGQTANVILIDGHLSKDDNIIVAKRDGVIVTKPKAMLLPKPLDETRDPRDKFKQVDTVWAAAGVKIASPELEGVLPGSTLYATSDPNEIASYEKKIEEEMKALFLDVEPLGVILKCDTIGSLEVMFEMLRREQISVAKADVGPVTRRDIMDAKAIKEHEGQQGVILAFNVKVLPDAREEMENHHIKIFQDDIMYNLLEEYSRWYAEYTANTEDHLFAEITPIAKFSFLKGYIFRNSDPAIFGIRVGAGVLKQKVQFMNAQGRRIGVIHQLQDGKKSLDEARTGEEVACSVNGVTVGRQVNEEDEFYTLPHPQEAKKLLTKYMHRLSPEQAEALNEIVDIQRRRDPAYGY